MLQGAQVVLRPGQPADLDALEVIFATPEVASWWHGYDRARIEREVLEVDDPDKTVYVIEAAGARLRGCRRAGITRALACCWCAGAA